MDRDTAIPIKRSVSAAVFALGLEYAREDGVNALPDDRRRPMGYYTANHATGVLNLPADASEPRP